MQNNLLSSQVMVVDNGQIIEYDSPQNLLENQDGSFYKYIKQSGLLKPNEDDNTSIKSD